MEQSISVSSGGVLLEADLRLVEGASGLVVFAHGSGSSRKSPRNRRVASSLNQQGLSTLLLDLLTAEEGAIDAIDASYRFDIALLGRRLGGATDALAHHPALRQLQLPIGYFGASTGAAAALLAAAERPASIRAIVSRGGRPDLAGGVLAAVRAPTLLIVGGSDTTVLRLNRAALTQLGAGAELAVVAGASHLFEEPGALEQVERLAASWFVRHLAGSTQPARFGARTPAAPVS